MGLILRDSIEDSSETSALEDRANQSYFVSTLHDAQRANAVNPHGISTINQLLDGRAASDPSLPAVGMPVPGPGDEKWGFIIYSESTDQKI